MRSVYLVITISALTTICKCDYTKDYNYCKRHCMKIYKHLACGHDCVLPFSPDVVEMVQPTLKFRQVVLDVHNELRNKIAGGNLDWDFDITLTEQFGHFLSPTMTAKDDPDWFNEVNRDNIPYARNMRVINYDEDLEYTAYCQGSRCLMAHDACRGTKKYDQGGQNFAAPNMYINDEATGKTSAGAILHLFYTEAYMMQRKIVDRFSDEIPKKNIQGEYGHFTQLAWAETEYVGCSRVVCKEWANVIRRGVHKKKLQNRTFLTCNYGPAGNEYKARVYKIANSISEVPTCDRHMRPNDKYPYLCGTLEPIPVPTPWGTKKLEAIKSQLQELKKNPPIIPGSTALVNVVNVSHKNNASSNIHNKILFVLVSLLAVVCLCIF